MDLSKMVKVAGLCGSLYTSTLSVPNVDHETLSYRTNSLCTGKESTSIFFRKDNMNYLLIDGTLPMYEAKHDGKVDWYVEQEISDFQLFKQYLLCKREPECMFEWMLSSGVKPAVGKQELYESFR